MSNATIPLPAQSVATPIEPALLRAPCLRPAMWHRPSYLVALGRGGENAARRQDRRRRGFGRAKS